ncbi:MAG: hypothetical protein P8163_19940 [Candidatus Thiodiazotropha sp.]
MAALQLLGIAGYSASLRAVQGCTSVAGTWMCRSDPCPVPPQMHPSRRPTDLFRLKETKMPFRHLEIVVLLFAFEHKHFTMREASFLDYSICYTLGFTKFELRNLSYSLVVK